MDSERHTLRTSSQLITRHGEDEESTSGRHTIKLYPPLCIPSLVSSCQRVGVECSLTTE